MTLKNTRVLVTGGAGFIGSELVRQLARAGAKVVVLDNLSSGRASNLDGLETPSIELVIGDIRDEALVRKLMKTVEIVYHLACRGIRHSIHSPIENHEINAGGSLGLLAAAREEGIKRFVHVSSSEVYGTARRVPMTEEHPTFPATVYGASKLAGECYARAYWQTYGVSTVIVRPFNTYGPRCHHEGDSGEVIPKFLLRALAKRPMVVFGDGSQTRDFMHVSDTARGVLTAGTVEEAVGETINLGSGEEITINDLAQEVSKAACQPHPELIYDLPRPGDILRLCADSRKAKNLLGFEPRVSLWEGLTGVKAWYLSLEESPERLLEQEVIRNWQLSTIPETGHDSTRLPSRRSRNSRGNEKARER